MKMGDKRGPEGYYNHVIYSCMYRYKWHAKYGHFMKGYPGHCNSQIDQFRKSV